MLTGSVAGGLVAQVSNLGVPYVLRAAVLLVTFVVAYEFMRDWGFTPTAASSRRGDQPRPEDVDRPRLPEPPGPLGHARRAVHHGRRHLRLLRHAAVPPRALRQPEAYLVAGLSAALVAGCPDRRRAARPATSAACSSAARRSCRQRAGQRGGAGCSSVWCQSFWLAVAALAVWGLVWSAAFPVRAAYLNELIPPQQRATVLSFDNLMASCGGVALQPALGRVADTSGYAASYVVCSALQLLALPFTWLARREQQPADHIERDDAAK